MWPLRRSTKSDAPVTAFAMPRLEAVPFFAGMERTALEAMGRDVTWFDLPGGRILFEENEPGDALYIVLGGALAIDRAGQREAEVHAGGIVGAASVLTGRPHSGTAIALRDTSLLRIPKPSFDRLLRVQPTAMMRVTAQIIDRLLHRPHMRGAIVPPRTTALLPVGGEPILPFARALSDALARIGARAAIVDSSFGGKTETEFDAIEAGHNRVLYCGEDDASSWSQLCVRRADHVLLVVEGAAPPQPAILLPSLQAAPWRHVDLVLLQEPARALPAPAAPWLEKIPVRSHYHLRRGHDEDMARLARMLSDRAVGLVLSGGGARAYGHIGVVRALREAGVHFDLLGGTSMGAIVAAGLAHEWGDEELRERMLDAFVRTSPLNDVTFPLLALTRGRKVTARLQKHFGEDRLEDLWRPYFACTSNLTTGRQQLHKTGPLWRVLRASVAIPGLLPPVIEDDQVLVDGAVINNLPVEAMTEWSRGPVIGVDVGRRENFRGVKRGPVARFLLGADSAAPGIVTMLMRAGTIGSEAETEASRLHVDMLIEPPLEGVGIRDWSDFDRAVEDGYRHTVAKLATIDLARFRS